MICKYSFSQQPNQQDYKVFAAVIKSEIAERDKSIVLIKKSIGDKEFREGTSLTLVHLESGDISSMNEVNLWTSDSVGNRPTKMDSSSRKDILDYCLESQNQFSFQDQFKLDLPVYFLKKLPIRKKTIDQDWKKFYSRYPGSAGIMSFSGILYAQDSSKAIIYYWIRRNGLNGHGAIAIFENTSGNWKLCFKTYLWWN